MSRWVMLVVGLTITMGCFNVAETPVDDPGDPPPVPPPAPPPPAAQLEWSAIPAFLLTVGVPVEVRLRDYLTDSSGSAAITLDRAVPAGLRLENGTISGTPTDATSSRDFVATADDGPGGMDPAVSAPFAIEVTEASTSLEFERATPEQIGIVLQSPGLPADATATVRYRKTGDASWKTAHPLLRIRPEWNSGGAPAGIENALAGTIFDLASGTAYDVEVTLTAPPAAPQAIRTVVSTRALPGATGAANKRATPADDLQAVFDALAPGDVLELANGTYDVEGLQIDLAGTAAAPIVIRGASRDGVVLRDTTDTIIFMKSASHVLIEDMTLQGSGVDSGTTSSSTGVRFFDSGTQEFITLRRLTMTGLDKGVIASGKVDSVLLYHCTLTGNNEWNDDFLTSNATWNDDGIRLAGEGNCAFENTLHGFGDTFAVQNRVFSAGVYYYRNQITMGGDDAFEGDYATRNIGFYDNHISNVATFLSLDPIWGGPLYCFRNVCVNTYRGPFKWNAEGSGFLVYNNTIVRAEGHRSWGWVQFNNGALRNWSFRNNLLVYHGTGGLMALESSGMDPIDFTHNGFHPDGDVWWTSSGSQYSSVAQARDSLPATSPVFGTSTRRHEHDRIVEREPFTTAVPVGATYRVEVTTQFVPTLDGSSTAKGAGTPIPGVTDGHSGAAPDMGAIIAGRSNPQWGDPR